MTQNSIASASEGLNKIIERILRLTPQSPEGFRYDENKTRYLQSAVINHDWALAPIRNIVTLGYKLNSFVTALQENLQLSEELKTMSTSSTTLMIGAEDQDNFGTNCQQYRRNPRDARKHEPSGGFSRGFGRFAREGRNMNPRGTRMSKAFANAQL